MAPIAGKFDEAGLHALNKWARTYLEDHLEMLERAHTDAFGRIRPPETRAEIKLLRDWIRRSAQLEEASGNRRLSVILSPGATLEEALTKPFPANQA